MQLLPKDSSKVLQREMAKDAASSCAALLESKPPRMKHMFEGAPTSHCGTKQGATDGPVNGAVDGGTAAAYVSLGAWAADERVFRPSQSVGPVDIQQLDASCMCVISDFMRMATLLEGRCIHGIFGFFGSSGPGSRSSERV